MLASIIAKNKAAKKKRARARKKGFRYGMPIERADIMDSIYEGALAVIAKAKAAGTFFDPEAEQKKREERTKFKLNRKAVKRRTDVLKRRLNGGADPEHVTVSVKASKPKFNFGKPKFTFGE